MTDLRHVVQLLHQAGATEGVGPTAMANWLGRRIREADRDSENEERTRRLESDARAVQVITIHRSKGLEFPIVLFPYAWDGYIHKIGVPVFHDPDRDHVRTVDVGGPARAGATSQAREVRRPGRGPPALLRRAARASTRWCCGGPGAGHGGLAALRGSSSIGPDRRGGALRDEEGRDRTTRSRPCARRSAQYVSVERVAAPTGARLPEQSEGAERSASVAVFDRTLDAAWRRASYSGITHDAHEAPAIGSSARGRGDDRRAGRGGLAGPPRRRTPVRPGARRTRPGGHAGRDAGRHDRARGPQQSEFDAPDLAGEVDRVLDGS